MQSKIVPLSGSFSNTCRYVCKRQERAEVLDAVGVRAHDHRLMAKDFESQREMRPERKKAVFHGILTFSPKENPSNALMTEIAHKYLDRMGFGNAQYVITRHTDTAHPHLHLIANSVDNNGAFIPDSWNQPRGMKIAHQLTEEYGLMPYLKKDLSLTHRDRLYGSDVQRYEIYEAITQAMPHCRTFEDLEKALLLKAIDTRYKRDERTGKRLGISFRKGKVCFKGGDIDAEFTYQRLAHTLAQQQKLDPHLSLAQAQPFELHQNPDSQQTLKRTQSPERQRHLLHPDSSDETQTPRHRIGHHL